jgi:hypothetical protein
MFGLLIAIALILLIFAIVGGLAVTKVLFWILIAVAIIAATAFATRGTRP